MLFPEYIPENPHDWLGRRLKAGDEAPDAAWATVDREPAMGDFTRRFRQESRATPCPAET